MLNPSCIFLWRNVAKAHGRSLKQGACLDLLLVLQSGIIHCLTVCAIQLLDQSSFDGL